jgi:hypothetical protein
MPMRPTDPSPEDEAVRLAFCRPVNAECRLRPCVWVSQLLQAIGFEPNAFVLVGHYPLPNANAADQQLDTTNPKIDPSLASMSAASLAAGVVANLAIRGRAGRELSEPLGDTVLLGGGGVLNGFLPKTMSPFVDTTFFTNAQLGTANLVR